MKKAIVALEKVPVVLSGHPWIFSGALETYDEGIEPGEIVQILDPKGEFLALGYMNPAQSLCLRILSYRNEPIEDILRARFKQAYQLRQLSGLLETTNAYRLINAEGDRLGGLIVDIYGSFVVLQIATQGMERLRPLILKILNELAEWEGMVERSDSNSRSQEGLEPYFHVHKGTIDSRAKIFENGVQLEVDLLQGQKTGYFLDQRPMRQFLAAWAKDRLVLNLFSYTGGFSLQALFHGAKEVVSVDVDKKALALLDHLVILNGFNSSRHKSYAQDVFDFLEEKQTLDCDLVILDPPAFAKKRQDIEKASKGYKKLFKAVLSKLKEGSYLYAASCSYFMDEKLFEKLLIQVAMETRVCLKLISPQITAVDHPRLLAHKEGSYLKGFFVQVFKS